MTSIAFRTIAALLLFAAVAVACERPQQPAVAPAARTVPPPVPSAPPKAAPSYVRDHYAKLEDCAHDWGYAQKCNSASNGTGGTTYLGPIYAKAYREETQAQLRKEAVDGGYSPQMITDASDLSVGKSEVRP